jgi:LruC domain-containing protein
MRTSHLRGVLGGLAITLAGSAAQAQSTSYYPDESNVAVLVFEDQWPAWTDYDYNDVVLQVHWRLDRNTSQPATANGYPVHRALLTVDPVALGGEYGNGLGLQLPLGVSKAGLVVRRRVRTGGSDASPVYGEWSDLALSSDAALTVTLSSNLRELFGNESGRLNVGLAGKDGLSGQRLEVELNWPVGADLDTSLAPFDLFTFRGSAPRHEVHFPAYGGTQAMNFTLFPANNGAGRWYLNDRGIPAALNLATATEYPTEASRIELVYPDILAFAAHGAQAGFGAAPDAGTLVDPRTFYQRPAVGGPSKQRGAPWSRPAAPAITREACTSGLAANEVGLRVRADSACVRSGCAIGFVLQGGLCVSTDCTPFSQVVSGPGATTVNIPPSAANCSTVTVKLWGGGGGGGGWDTVNGGDGGGGAFATASVSRNGASSVAVYVGGGGLGAQNNESGGPPGTNGYSAGNGGWGASKGPCGGSGGGGGGGAATVVVLGGQVIAVAGGGGGGGGAGRYSDPVEKHGAAGGAATTGALASGAGGGGLPWCYDGGGGGGGGGGAAGGAGGSAFTQFDWTAHGGGGGGSFTLATAILRSTLAGSGRSPANSGDADFMAGRATGGTGNSGTGTAGLAIVIVQ